MRVEGIVEMKAAFQGGERSRPPICRTCTSSVAMRVSGWSRRRRWGSPSTASVACCSTSIYFALATGAEFIGSADATGLLALHSAAFPREHSVCDGVCVARRWQGRAQPCLLCTGGDATSRRVCRQLCGWSPPWTVRQSAECLAGPPSGLPVLPVHGRPVAPPRCQHWGPHARRIAGWHRNVQRTRGLPPMV